MKKGDIIWGAILLAFIAFIVVPATNVLFITFTSLHPYLGGFLKFGLLATMGEMLAGRIATGEWKKAPGFIFRVIIWGLLGMVITLIFQIYAGGVTGAMAKGYLPFEGVSFAFAFATSALMNLFFAPTFMAFHRYTDTYLDMKYGEGITQPSVKQVAQRIDWYGFISFVVLKTIPFFWIPAHTITFLLPGEYRVLMAAFLSMALGLLLAIGKRKKSE